MGRSAATLNSAQRKMVTLLTVGIMAVALVAMLTAGTASAIGPPEATLYENKDFNNDGKKPGGDTLVVTGDISCLADSPHNFDNKTHSIKVNPGTIVTVFDKCGFDGKSETFSAHDSDLHGNDIGKDKVSSIKISVNGQSLGNDHQEL
jgi:hypothetical protein